MKVLDLRCVHDHRFEGWFGSEDDYLSQHARGLVACPLCGDTAVVRLPSAPRLNFGALKDREAATAAPLPSAISEVADVQGMQQQWMQAMRRMMAATEDVGERFPDEARRIHHGEVEARGIRGRASREDAEALREEGIEVMSIALPDALKETLQ